MVPLLIFPTFYTIQTEVPQARASHVGRVCIAETVATRCPMSPLVFTGPVTAPATQLIVAVFLDTSSSLNGFDVTLKTDSTILKPVDTLLTGTLLLGTPIVSLKCIGGVLQVGLGCATTDNGNTIHLAATNGLGTGVTAHPTTGLLFKAVFNITRTTSTSGVTIGYQTGCSPTSVLPDTCVVLLDETETPVPETAQTGDFDNGTPPPFVTVSPNPTSIGPLLPGGTATSSITATPQNGFQSELDPSVVYSTAVTSAMGLSAIIAPARVDLLAGAASSTLTISTTSQTPPGDYSAIVSAEYHLTNPVTLVVSTLSVPPVTLPAKVVDFTIAANPTSVGPLIPGKLGTVTITVGALNGFAGTVILSTSSLSSTDLTTILSTTSVIGSGTATLTVSSFDIGTYTLKVRGNSGTRFKDTVTITVTVNVVRDVAIAFFTTSTASGTVGTKVIFTINLQNKGTVDESVTVTALAGNLIVAMQNIPLAAGSTRQVILIWDTTGYVPGTYALSVKVAQVPGETSTSDNQQSSGTLSLAKAPTDDPLLANLLLMVSALAMALVATFLVLRRRSPGNK